MLKAVENTQLAFNYDIVPEPVAIQAREAAQRIKLRLRRSAEDIIEIGRDLLAVKERIGHGNFTPWLQAEFGMSEHTARRFMGVARQFGDKTSIVRDLDPTALYELAAPKTPIEVREEIEKMIEAGEVVTKATIAQLNAEIETAKKGRELADNDAAAAEEKASTLKADLDGLNGSIDERVSVEVAKTSAEIRSGYEEEIERLKAQLDEFLKPKNTTTIDNETGNIVQFHRELTPDEAANVDAADDELIGADFNEVASETERAIAFFGAVRAMSSAKANPAAVYAYITKRTSQDLINEYMGMVGDVLSQLQAIKEMDNV
ncbi:DUF3102 domain-containing protein [Shinella zoogloeoides]|uniref:DUF3102 domain-containing protein n=1 Tax=Shinella zoogloeoides TaxID=352475 RepID=UPI00299D6512|nr:DUF3102 domain-containing protein [Shinella zoogloeoides]WPE22456.1 hypothetical protein ShzoTeo12_36720 [Shinella zoogloeoides]